MFQRLKGFRDFYPEDCSTRNFIFSKWKRAARLHGFAEYDSPILEPLDLFTAKSGDEIVGQLFNFTDKGGREVSLRPELTPSLARLAGAKASALKRPIKWFNVGENFRYERMQKGRLRSFYQFNADILGEASAGADAELLSLLTGTFATFGFSPQDVVVRLSDRDLWLLYLEAFGISQDNIPEVLAVVDKMERAPQDLTLKNLEPFFGPAAEDFFIKVDTLCQVRDLSDLRAFMLGHAPDGDIKTRMEARLNEWGTLMAALDSLGLTDWIQIDLAVVRGLAYYTGFVFEAFERQGENRALAGGGRYDDLLEKLGYPAMPACGFGMGDVTLQDAMEERNLLPTFVDAPEVYVVIGGPDERDAALQAVSGLRLAAIRVEYPLKDSGFGKQFKAAGGSGAPLALIFGKDEVAQGGCKLKDLVGGDEAYVMASQIIPAVRDALANGGLNAPDS